MRLDVRASLAKVPDLAEVERLGSYCGDRAAHVEGLTSRVLAWLSLAAAEESRRRRFTIRGVDPAGLKRALAVAAENLVAAEWCDPVSQSWARFYTALSGELDRQELVLRDLDPTTATGRALPPRSESSCDAVADMDVWRAEISALLATVPPGPGDEADELARLGLYCARVP